MKDARYKKLKEKLKNVDRGIVEHRLHYPQQSNHGKLAASGTLATSGKAILEDYHLMHGVHFSHYYIIGNTARDTHGSNDTVVEINHCQLGRLSWHMADGTSLQLGPGDMALHSAYHCHASTMDLPLGYYEGISIHIDLPVLAKNLPPALKEARLDYCRLFNLLCTDNKPLYLKESCLLDKLISPLYDLPAEFTIPYLQLKVQEIILLLAAMPRNLNNNNANSCTAIERTKEIHQLITGDLAKRYTIEELAKKYHTNTTTLKNDFKALYGSPIAAYMREYRIQTAINLMHEGLPLTAIAKKLGYESQSKFTLAFKKIMGELPSLYRKNLILLTRH